MHVHDITLYKFSILFYSIRWDEAEELATDRAEWRQRVAAQCIHLNAC